MPTPPPIISPAPTAPQRGDRTTFSSRVDAFLTWLVGAVPQFATVAENVYDNAVEAVLAATTVTNDMPTVTSARDTVISIYDLFHDRYLGSKTDNPSLDNDGDTLLVGAIYWNSYSSEMRAWTGSAWVACYIPDAFVARINVAQQYTKPQRPSVSVEATPSGGGITWDIANDTILRINLASSITSLTMTTAPSAALVGGQYEIVIRYNGGTSIAWPASFKWTAGNAPTLTGTTGKIDILTFVVASPDGVNYYLVNTGIRQNVG